MYVHSMYSTVYVYYYVRRYVPIAGLLLYTPYCSPVCITAVLLDAERHCRVLSRGLLVYTVGAWSRCAVACDEACLVQRVCMCSRKTDLSHCLVWMQRGKENTSVLGKRRGLRKHSSDRLREIHIVTLIL